MIRIQGAWSHHVIQEAQLAELAMEHETSRACFVATEDPLRQAQLLLGPAQEGRRRESLRRLRPRAFRSELAMEHETSRACFVATEDPLRQAQLLLGPAQEGRRRESLRRFRPRAI